MKILLINPTRYSSAGTLRKLRRTFFTPMTMPYLAALVPHGHEVTICDEIIQDVPTEGGWDLVGITTNTLTIFRAYELADRFRKAGVPVAMGGIHATAAPDEALGHADFVFVGEADETWPAFLSLPLSSQGSRLIRPERRPDLAGLPVPRFDLLRTRRDSRPVVRALGSLLGLPVYSVQTSRGCPHACDFCSVSLFYGRAHRLRPIPDVIKEIRSLGARIVFFADEDIFLNKERSSELFEALLPLRIIWMAQAGMAAGDDDDLLKLARRSGCRGLLVGTDSLSAPNLESMGKGFNATPTYRRRLRAFRRAGIEAEISLMFGFDGEGPEAFDEAFRFLTENRVRHSAIWPLTPLPGTVLFHRLKEQGRLPDEAWWLHRNISKPRLKFSGASMDEAEFESKFTDFRRRFYSRGRLLRRFAFPPTPQNLFGLIWTLSVKQGIED